MESESSETRVTLSCSCCEGPFHFTAPAQTCMFSLGQYEGGHWTCAEDAFIGKGMMTLLFILHMWQRVCVCLTDAVCRCGAEATCLSRLLFCARVAWRASAAALKRSPR